MNAQSPVLCASCLGPLPPGRNCPACTPGPGQVTAVFAAAGTSGPAFTVVNRPGLRLAYDGTPALGTLARSAAMAAGTDPYGNDYPAGQWRHDIAGPYRPVNGVIWSGGGGGPRIIPVEPRRTAPLQWSWPQLTYRRWVVIVSRIAALAIAADFLLMAAGHRHTCVLLGAWAILAAGPPALSYPAASWTRTRRRP
jgi:hypothetical protein